MWKNLTKAELDAAYNNSKAVENSAQIIQTWLESSAIVKDQSSCANDIPYGQENFPALDFYLANKAAPTIAFIHGGFWQMRSKNDFAFIVPTLIKNNLNVAMIGYRLAPKATMDEIIGDVKNGIDTTVKFLQSQSFLSDSLWLVGWSAGGHLAVMQSHHPKVLGVTAISGIYDLEPMQYCYVNDLLKLDEDSVKRNSPILLQQDPSKIIDIFVGNSELEQMQNQSIQFAQYRQNNNALGKFINIPHANHYTILDELTREDGVILDSLKQRIHAIQSIE